VQEEVSTIAAQGSADFEFALQMETDRAGNWTCKLLVTDSIGQVAAVTEVQFYTTDTKYTPPPEQSYIDDKARATQLCASG
jgi:hypothetical protein